MRIELVINDVNDDVNDDAMNIPQGIESRGNEEY